MCSECSEHGVNGASGQQSLFAPSSDEPLNIVGFTFWRPWGDAIVRAVPPGATAPHPKRIDNRPNRPPANRIGRHIAIHTGQTTSQWGLDWLRDVYGYTWTNDDCSPSGRIIGVARVVGVIEHGDVPWYFGPVFERKKNYGWILDDVRAIEPVTGIKGKLGCWALDADVLSMVRERYAKEMSR